MAGANQGDVVVTYTGVGVLLMSHDFDSGSINPDFLRYNGIVDGDWRVEGPITAEPGLSRIVYDNGVVVTASRDHVTFLQAREDMDLDDCVSPAVAMRFTSSVAPRSGYQAVAVDPRGFIRRPEGVSGASATVLSTLGGRLPFGGQLPYVQARVAYELEDRDITLYVAEVAPEYRFSAHIHHHVGESRSVRTDSVCATCFGFLEGRSGGF